jgi:PDDEXK-like domain of unknown function (DUF3799)
MSGLAEVAWKPWIADPGIHVGMVNSDYHRDPVIERSVSSTLLRKMSPPDGCAATGRHYLDHGDEPKGFYDLGSAVHTGVLGVGEEIVEVDADSWRTAAARDERDAIRAAGKLPLLARSPNDHPSEVEIVEAMVAAVRVHEITGPLFEPGTFTAEIVIVWRDPSTRVMCRAMLDAVPHYNRRMIIVDLKTTARGVDPGSISRLIAQHGYHQQLAFYRAGARALGHTGVLVPPPDAIDVYIVFVSTQPPHLITVRPIGERSLNWGDRLNRAALRLYAKCRETERWPGHDDYHHLGALPPIEIPRWAEYVYEQLPPGFFYDPHEQENW